MVFSTFHCIFNFQGLFKKIYKGLHSTRHGFKTWLPSELSFLILCKNGARCDIDHGEVGLGGNRTGEAPISGCAVWPCSASSGVWRGRVRPANRDFNKNMSGYKFKIFLKKIKESISVNSNLLKYKYIKIQTFIYTIHYIYNGLQK